MWTVWFLNLGFAPVDQNTIMVLGTACKVSAVEAYDKTTGDIVDNTKHKIFFLDEHIRSNIGLLQVFGIVRKP